MRRYHERVQASRFRIDVGPFYEENTRHSSRRTSRSASSRWRASLLFARMKKIGKIRWINWSEINVEGKSMRKEIHILSNLRCSWKQRVCTTRVTQRTSLLVWSQPYLHHSPRPILRQDVPGCLLFRENTNRESETAKADTPRAASSKEKQKAILWDIHSGTGGLATWRWVSDGGRRRT